MPTLLRMPEIATNTTEATLLSWPVAANTPFLANDTIATVETAKAIVDVEAESDGVILRTLVAEGTEVKVGDPIAVLGTTGESVEDLNKMLADLGLDSTSDAVSSAVPVQVDTGVHPLAMNGALPTSSSQVRRFASPLARRLAREAGLVLADIAGSGPNQRIVRRDVEAAITERAAQPALAEPIVLDSVVLASAEVAPRAAVGQPAITPTAITPTAITPTAITPTGYRDVPHSKLRKAIAGRLVESVQTTPHFYLNAAVRVGKLLKLRQELNAEAGTRVSVNDLIVKAIAHAHLAVPAMNAIWTAEAVRLFESVDVAVAVATDRGLVTPVVRGVEAMSISTLSERIRDYAVRAREGTLQQRELEGGSITVSNLGMYGTQQFSAIINPPHAAIVAVGAAAVEPVEHKGKVKLSSVMRLTVSVDHRPVDGKIAAQWLHALVTVLEHPLRIVS